MERYVCAHAHFYQPPRENPWLEAVELQDSAYPYHDWNERITQECYAPNATSRILDPDGRIIRLVNNYSRISFNFGPTLMAWMEKNSPDAYAAIVEGDRQSQERFSGHGSALAQAYNHMILPLANRRDKRTQIIWGIRDFEFRFGRKMEGMWLPETAVDIETLEIMAEQGVLFTILAPSQASRVRGIDESEWHDVSGAKIDPTMAYRLGLPSGRSLSLFFYDGPISLAVAFEGLLNDGEAFANRILGAFNDDRAWAQIAHIATDGESYGHHHRNGDMALAYALDYIESHDLAKVTNYGEFLEKYPPSHEVEIFENTSWSCIHGIERWSADCGCNSGGYPDWNQAWRAPLRATLDWLRDSLAAGFHESAGKLVRDPWAARNGYIDVVMDRSPESIERFIGQHVVRGFNEADRITLLKLMELQRHTMLMYTSCGWFFDELSGIETVQILQYAGRAVQLGEELFGGNIESQFLERLEAARSNIAEHRDGRHIYEKWVKPATVDLTRVAAHYAISSVFEEYPGESSVFSYDVVQDDYQVSQVGRAKLTVGRARFTSKVTLESRMMAFGVLYMGDHNLNCGVTDCEGEDECESFVPDLVDAFARADFPESIRLMDGRFGASTYSLTSLFRDAQRNIMDSVLEPTVGEAKSAFGQIYEHHAPLIRFLKASGMPIPWHLHAVAEFVLNARLRRALGEEPLDPQSIEALIDEMNRAGAVLEATSLEFAIRNSLEGLANRLLHEPGNGELLRNLQTGVTLVDMMPFVVNLRKVQDIFCRIMHTVDPEYEQTNNQGEELARQWVKDIRGLADKLWITSI